MNTIIDNLFNLDILNKTNNIINDNNININKRINSSLAYTKHKYTEKTPNPSLQQGYKFKNYQNKITTIVDNKETKFISKKSKNKEGFSNNNNNMAQQSNALLNTVKTSTSPSQQKKLAKLKQEYEKTLKQYTDLSNQISQGYTSYSDRISSSNPYLNKYIKFNTGQIFFVTNQGVAKYIATTDILNSISGVNGCPSAASANYIDISVPWSNDYNIPGTQLPTTPPLVIGTNMAMNESCGNEGRNVFVSSMLNNPNASYVGCYQDSSTTPAMTFVGGGTNFRWDSKWNL